MPDDLEDHIRKTYFSLRIGLAVLAALLPVLLVVLGYLAYEISLQPSLSDYYFALADSKPPLRNFPMRGYFVGILCAIGSFLILYRGFSNTENWLLNIAGVSAIGVALVYMTVPKTCEDCGGPVFTWWPQAHFYFAVVLFLCIAWVAWACSEETLGELPPDKQKKYRSIYDRFALGMLLFPVVAWVLTKTLGMDNYLVLAVEALGVWTFAGYWYVKSMEMQISRADISPKARSLSPPAARPMREGAPESAPGARSAKRTPSAHDSLRMRAARIFDSAPMQELKRTQ